MPIYEFTPVDPGHPGWESSDLKGQCRVHAPDEQRAVHYLRAWLDPDLYDCIGVTKGPLPEYREGLIEVDQRRGDFVVPLPFGKQPPLIDGGRWVSFNEDALSAPTSAAWGKDAWGKGAWGGAPEEDAEPATEPELVEITASDTLDLSLGEVAGVRPVEVRDAMEATRRQFADQPQELVARARMARANTAVALEILEEFRGNSEEHARVRTLLTAQAEILGTIEEDLSSGDSNEPAFDAYAGQLHKILKNLAEVMSEKGVIRSALAVAACGLVAMTGTGGEAVIGPLVAAAILGWDQEALLKLVDGLGKLRKTREKDDD